MISGNSGDGIDLSGGATSTLIQNNYIGVDQTGTQPVGNQGSGLSVNGASGVTIGGTLHGSGNVISANAQSGVSIGGGSGTGIIVVGNFIGTDYTGTNAVGNLGDGVAISDPPGVTIGGTVAGSQNIISANKGAGIALSGQRRSRADRGQPDRHRRHRLQSAGQRHGHPGRRRLVEQHDRRDGRGRGQYDCLQHRRRRRRRYDRRARATRSGSIRSSRTAGLGIQLGSGVTTNAPGGPHTGPNDLQNYPGHHQSRQRRRHHDHQRYVQQHAEHDVRTRFLRAVGRQCFGLRRGPIRPRFAARHDRYVGQRDVHLLVPDAGAGSHLRLGDGDRPQRQHVGILARLRQGHPANSGHRLHELDGR